MAPEQSGGLGRRTFLAALGGAVGLATSACRAGESGLEQLQKARFGAPPVPDVSSDVSGGVISASEDRSVTVNWTTAPDIAYDAELNGAVIAADVAGGTFRLGFGDQLPGFTAGPNTLRVLARAAGQTSPSRPVHFAVRPAGTMPARLLALA